MMVLAEHEAKALLEKAEVPVVPVKVLHTLEEAGRMDYPVALKLSSTVYTHKTEVGGVILGIEDREGLEEAYNRLARLRNELDPGASIIVEPMAAPGVELFIGAQRRQGFGLVMTIGVGGIWLELMRDVAFRLLPASRYDLESMLSELKGWPKLRDGFRHLPPANPEALLDLMEKAGAFATSRIDLVEMDLNPVFAYSDRAVVVDARMVFDQLDL